jgi:hypothetical protein
MKKSVWALVFTAFLVLAINPPVQGLADNSMEVSVITGYARIDLYNVASFMINVSNSMDSSEDFQIYVSGRHSEWLVPGIFYATIQGNSYAEIPIRFYPTGDDYGTYNYTLVVQSKRFSELNASVELQMVVIPPVIINNIDIQKAGAELDITLDMDARRKQDLGIDFGLSDSQGKMVATNSIYQEAEGITAIRNTLSIPEYLPAGAYTLVVSIQGKNIQASEPLVLGPVHDVVKTIERKTTISGEEVVISLKNNGNVAERGYEVYQAMPSGFLTGFITQPQSCSQADGSNSCRYVIAEIAPGATAQVSYTVLYWPTVAQYAAGIVILGVVGFFAFSKVTKPTVTKRYARKGTDTYHIILEIKNPFFHRMNNVILRDWLTPLASFVHHETEAFKPILRTSEAGTEVIWKLGDIKPNEVRYVTYKIKTALSKSLKMPRAYARFVTPKGKRIRVYSSQIVLD